MSALPATAVVESMLLWSNLRYTTVLRALFFDVAEYGILVMSMHPGWVLTEMGGPNALIDTETCAKTMLETLYALTEKDHGSFLRYNNTPIQW